MDCSAGYSFRENSTFKNCLHKKNRSIIIDIESTHPCYWYRSQAKSDLIYSVFSVVVVPSWSDSADLDRRSATALGRTASTRMGTICSPMD